MNNVEMIYFLFVAALLNACPLLCHGYIHFGTKCIVLVGVFDSERNALLHRFDGNQMHRE
jgi:hypothetical protein